jgi:hypothetical protein
LGQVALSGAVLGLLVGTPSPACVWVSGAVAAIFLGYVALLLYAGTSARSFEARLASDEIQVIDQGDIEGLGCEYYLKVPNEQWFLRSEEATKRENSVAYRWLVRPDRDAHFIVIADRFPAMNIDVANYEKEVLQNLENVATSLQLLKSRQLWEHLSQSRLVRARATLRGLSIDYV